MLRKGIVNAQPQNFLSLIYITLISAFTMYVLGLPPSPSPSFIPSFLPSPPIPSLSCPLPNHSSLHKSPNLELFPLRFKMTGVRCLAAACMTRRSTAVLPVEEILLKWCSSTALATYLPPPSLCHTNTPIYKNEREGMGGEGK